MKQLTAAVLTAAIVCLTAAAILAHEVTYEGTVAAVESNRYAASDGVIARLEVKVSDRKRTMRFDITQKTRLLRGNSAVSFAVLRIQRDERVAVTVNHDEPSEGALEIRLERLSEPVQP